ncbi:DUF2789 family protein [Salinivibrio costicola]|uniref:DUF2789 family protein n=1 Tax=Salinivibrio costicola TaxID=51367 RepID=UPI002E8DCCEB|nr:DUF2789 family protein [Salinivibrio costicola]
METFQHDLQHLFEQLGLDSDHTAITQRLSTSYPATVWWTDKRWWRLLFGTRRSGH